MNRSERLFLVGFGTRKDHSGKKVKTFLYREAKGGCHGWLQMAVCFFRVTTCIALLQPHKS